MDNYKLKKIVGKFYSHINVTSKISHIFCCHKTPDTSIYAVLYVEVKNILIQKKILCLLLSFCLLYLLFLYLFIHFLAVRILKFFENII